MLPCLVLRDESVDVKRLISFVVHAQALQNIKQKGMKYIAPVYFDILDTI